MKTIVEKLAFDTTTRPPVYCEVSFLETDGFLFHVIDGKVRAQVSAAHIGDYLDSLNVSQQLQGFERAAIDAVFLGAKVDPGQAAELSHVETPVNIVTDKVEIIS